MTRQKLKNDLNLLASTYTIGKAMRRLGWRKVTTKYCQIVEPRNRVKRFIYCCFCKIFKEDFQDTIDADETTVELRLCANSNWFCKGNCAKYNMSEVLQNINAIGFARWKMSRGLQ